MSTDAVISMLIGEEVVHEWGVLPDRGVVFQPPLQIGDGLAGPQNDQPLQIFRDTRPLPVDELGMGHLGKLARHAAGRYLPWNDHWNAGLDESLPGMPLRPGQRPSALSPGQTAAGHEGVPAPAVLRSPRTVVYTATPAVGWEGW